MIKPCIFLPNEYIVHKGDIGHGMYFIYHGKVSLLLVIVKHWIQLMSHKFLEFDILHVPQYNIQNLLGKH